MNEDWKNAFGILMCREICDGADTGICDGVPSTYSSSFYNLFTLSLGQKAGTCLDKTLLFIE